MKELKTAWIGAVLVVLMLVVLCCVYLSTRHRTEAGFQRNALTAIQQVSDSQIFSVFIRWRWAKPDKTVTLACDSTKDAADIKRLMKAIREDLTVSSCEINPNGKKPQPAYDMIRIVLMGGKILTLNCWIGKEGGENPSLTIRSRRGEFKRTIQEITKQQFKPTTPLEVRDKRVTVRMSRVGTTNEFRLTAEYAGKLNGTWFITAAADLFDFQGKEVRARTAGTGRFHWKEDNGPLVNHSGDSRGDNPLRETLVLDMQGLAPGRYSARPSVDIFYEKKAAHLTNAPEGIRPGKVVDISFTIK